MKRYQILTCILVVIMLLMPLSVSAAQSDADAYAELFKSGTDEQILQAFEDDPHMFVSVLSEEKYGRMIEATYAFTNADADIDRERYQELLLKVAQENELNQAERRTVRWTLDALGAEFDMWAVEIDYTELFGRCAEMDGALPAYYAVELEEVFWKDPYRFLQEMAESDVELSRLSEILMNQIYHGNSDRQETLSFLQEMERSGKLTDAQRQMWLELWRAEGVLIGYYGLPFDMGSTTQIEALPTEATEPEASGVIHTDTTLTAPTPTELTNATPWWYIALGVLFALVAIILSVYLRRKK